MNTKYFHHSASSRCRKNGLLQLSNNECNICSWGSGLEELIQEHYKKDYSSNGAEFSEVLQLIQPRVTMDHN